jgi:type II secretory pathway pseudopilin PulG
MMEGRVSNSRALSMRLLRPFRREHEGQRQNSAGFTLIEVAITIGILVTLAVAVTELLSSSIEIRGRLSQSGKVSHRLATAMARVSEDLNHTFVLKATMTNRKSEERPTLFSYETRRNSVELKLTTQSKRSVIADSKEGDLTYVVYKVMDDPEVQGITHLYRGETPFVPKNLREDPPMRLVAKNIKSLRVEAWRGDRWVKDRWDTTRSEFRDQIPRMLRVEIEGWVFSPEISEGSAPDMDKEPTETFSTVIFVPLSANFSEEKVGSSTVRWDRL